MPHGFNPLRSIELAAGFRDQVPDIMEFCLSDRYLNRPYIFPRQATLLKILFLQKELLTQYDYDVIGEWTESYVHTADEHGIGNNGIQPDVLERIDICLAEGRPWFRETLNVSGRRGSKGHIGGYAGSYVLWNYMSWGDPQGHFGVDRDKKMEALVFAGKKEQARANQWKDLTNVILGGPCFAPYISRALGEIVTVYAPHDFERMFDRWDRGVFSEDDLATFEIKPKESTLMSARGPASFCLDPSTPVLTTDLRWVPIGDLVVGDRVIGLDEQTSGGQRKMRDAEVQAVVRTRKPSLRLTFEDGTDVVCSEDHRWLTKEMGSSGSTRWREASGLRIGNRIKHLVDPWVEDRSWGGGYLTGMFDGEGCVSGWSGRAGASVFISQKSGPVLDQILALLRERGFDPVRSNVGEVEQWALSGQEAMTLLGTLRPSRLMTKSNRVWEGVAPRAGMTSSGRIRPESHKTIVAIEHLPEQDLVDIQTSTGTFIANGLVSHNCQFYDEMAHVVATGANRSAEEVYDSATPSLDQFKKWAFIYEPSSPWQKTGQFYVNYLRSVEKDEETGLPAYPEMLMIQLASWDIYKDWEIANDLFDRPGGMRLMPLKGAIQEYDEQMRRLERANPETFKVERRAHFATVMDAYLNEEKVKAMWEDYKGQPLEQQSRGALSVTYRAHGDPSKSGAGFGYAIAHIDGYDANGMPHVVFDKIHSWNPADFENNEIDYSEIETDIKGDLDAFMPSELTFDQFNSVSTIQNLRKHVRTVPRAKQTQIYERTATGPLNWKTYETFKTALNMGLIHGPYHELADLELRFLQDRGGKVEKPTSGPVQTKDVADCIAIVTYELIGEQMSAFIGKALSDLPVAMSHPGGFDPRSTRNDEALSQLSGFGRARRAPGSVPGRRRRG